MDGRIAFLVTLSALAVIAITEAVTGYSAFSIFMAASMGAIVVMGGVFLAGRGSMAVAGLNTASPMELASLNVKAVTEAVGALCVSIGVLVHLGLVLARYSVTVLWIVIAASIVLPIALLAYTNRSPRFRRDPNSAEPAEAVFMSKKAVVLAVALSAVIVIGSFAFAFSGSVDATVGDTQLSVDSEGVAERISYADITSVEIVDGFDRGAGSGFNGFVVKAGRYTNDPLGSYTLASYRNIDKMIIVKHAGGTLAFNQSSDAATQALYDSLKLKV